PSLPERRLNVYDVRTLEALLADGSLSDVEDARRHVLRLRDRGRLDRVLGMLLARTPKDAVRLRRVRAGAVALVREFCADERSPNDDEHRWPEVDRGLGTGLIPLEVAVQEMRTGSVDGLRRWLDRMDRVGDPPPILDPFRILLVQEWIPVEIPDPAEFPADGLRALLQLARCLDQQGGTGWLPALLGRLPDAWGQVAEPFQRFSGPDVSSGASTRAGTNGVLAVGGSGRGGEVRENVAHGSELLLWQDQR
ncbi:hypothetical protein, partial [Protofrankia symbiont of Coriaria ruscifolia]|uniref:hypothetical protein n=1 Tax=Protofrankia symbiont of Coriaria ruscifolia TaxID=1306542 RepID=UPI0013EFAB76